jgi:hypothetical protein
MNRVTQMKAQTRSKRARLGQFALGMLTPAILATVMASAASAQDVEPPALVGRISGIDGGVSMIRAGEQEWFQAGVNEPISIGDAVYTQDGGDARLEIGATSLFVQPDSEIDIATLDQSTGQIRLDTGTLDLRVSALPTTEGLSIATPRGTVQLTQVGVYRISAGTEDQPTTVTAWNGAAQLGNTSAAITVQPGQTLSITGTTEQPQYAFQGAPGALPTEWRTPPHVFAASEQRYVAADMTGAEDLYQYGAFQTVQQYGAVWYPRNVPADWQPYRYGHWEYVAPWGQTWIDDQPWGFAPFHYGRWAYVGNRWGWVPGQYEPHPVYAPALVAFVGGGGFSAAISFGGGAAIGWVPLGPGEVYRPPYHVSETYVQNINKTVIINNTTINNFRPGQERPVASLANARFATVVPAAAMSGGRPIAAVAMHVQPQALQHVSANPQVVTEVPRAPATAAHPAARPGPVAPVAITRGGPAAPRPALPPAHGPGAQPGRPVAPVKQEEQPARPGAPTKQEEQPARPGATPVPPRANAPTPERPATPPANRPEAARPEAGRPETARPESARPETAKPEAARPEAARPEAKAPPKPAETRPEAQRAESQRPEPQRTEPQRTEPQRPEPQRTEPQRPEAARPEARPEAKPPAASPRPETRPEAKPPAAAPHPEARPEAKPPAAAPHPEARPEAKPEPKKPEPKKPEPKRPEDENK